MPYKTRAKLDHDCAMIMWRLGYTTVMPVIVTWIKLYLV